MCYLIDLDGTLANIQHRLHWIKTKPKNHTAFFRAMVDDEPIKPVVDLVFDLWEGGAEIIYVSGRPDNYRQQTQDWLKFHGLPSCGLYMRRAGDFRPDDIVKEELLNQIKADGYNPVIALDDRVRVCRMWRRNGIICMQLNEEEF